MAAALIPGLILFTAVSFILISGTSVRPRPGVAAALAWTGILGSVVAGLRLWELRLSAWGWVESDSLGHFLNLLVLSGFALAMPVVEVQRESLGLDGHGSTKLRGWFLFSAVGMLLMSSTRNLALVFVALEGIGVAARVLSGRGRSGWIPSPPHRESSGRTPGRLRGGPFSLALESGSVLFVLGLVCLFVTAKTLDIAAMETVLASRSGEAVLPVIGLSLVVLGLFGKVAAFAFLVAAPGTKNSSLLAVLAILTQVAVFGVLLRLTGWLVSLGGYAAFFLGLLSVLALGVGNFRAMRDSGLLRRLALCSLTHVGYLAMGAAVGGVEARSAILLYLLVYTLMSIGAITVASSFENGSREWRGLVWRYPLSGLALSVLLASLAAIPPAGGFLARFYLLLATVAGERSVLAAVGLLGTFLGAYCYLKILIALYRPTSVIETEDRTLGLGTRLSLLVTSFLVLLIGVWPGPWLALARQTALAFF